MSAEPSVGQKRRTLSRLLVQLLMEMHADGLEAQIEYVYRSPEEAARLGKVNSLHTLGLAVDISLFTAAGEYLGTTEAHRKYGVLWESWAPVGMRTRWGGNFPGDGNHYSIEHGGRA